MDAAGLLQVFRRRYLAIALCVVAGLAGALLLNRATAKVYESKSLVFVNIPTGGNVTQQVGGVTLAVDLLPSYAQLASSTIVVEKVKQQLGLQESVDALRGRVSAKALAQKLILEIDVDDPDPVRARSIAAATTLALESTVADLQKSVNPAFVVNLQVIDPASRGRQIAPRTTYNTVLGVALGLAAGVVVALVLEALDRSVKTGAQTEASTHAPVLGVVPRRLRGGAQLAALGNDATAETYRTLRTGVTFADPDNPPRVIMVTSATEGEGKTTTAVNLAIALAQSGERTVIVDADLRRASVATMLGLEGAVGVTSVITKTARLEDALQVWQDGLIVLPAGTLPPNPSEIVGSQAMGRLIQDLHDYADVIVIDSPPVIPVTDAVVLSTQVEGVILVVRAGRTQRAQASEARRRLDGVQATVIGSVLNGAKRSSAAGYYAAYHPGTGARTGV
ncbi:MAG: tyrosine-protein kinase [Frankiales bacterium]|nr:tyrosine-protein kinase [Frankiales bacterium]